MKPMCRALTASIWLALAAGCEQKSADGPPPIRLGDSVCEQCNMIISDERWATATIVEGPRGPEAKLFDDFNCQVNYEVEHKDLAVVARWSHAHNTRKWLRTEQAHFVMSPALRTPMGSNTAAFASMEHAEAMMANLLGDQMAFEVAWLRLGFAGACCPTHEAAGEGVPQEVHNVP
jgi:copper chaperone NosL